MKKILLVDDDLKICGIIKKYLERDGFDVSLAHTGKQAQDKLQTEKYCFIIFDAMLPDSNGFELLNGLRSGEYFLNSCSADTDTPAIMLTALGHTNNVLKGLRDGADDYIVKPFEPRELVERIHVILKRVNPFVTNTLDIENISINLTTQIASCNDVALDLQRREYDLLCYLCKNPYHTLSREQLIGNVWGWDYNGGDRAVDICIKRLRQKLQNANANIEIATVWGVGYRLEIKKR